MCRLEVSLLETRAPGYASRHNLPSRRAAGWWSSTTSGSYPEGAGANPAPATIVSGVSLARPVCIPDVSRIRVASGGRRYARYEHCPARSDRHAIYTTLRHGVSQPDPVAGCCIQTPPATLAIPDRLAPALRQTANRTLEHRAAVRHDTRMMAAAGPPAVR